MDEDQLKLYRALSRAPFPRSYVGKVFLTAFLGTHVPLVALLVYFGRHQRFAIGGVLLALREAGQVFSSTLESEEVVTRLLEIMRSVAGLTAAVVSRYDQGGTLHLWRSAGLEDLWPRVRFTRKPRPPAGRP
jgi:hypothetical protein